jgi:hypothetical protein
MRLASKYFTVLALALVSLLPGCAWLRLPEPPPSIADTDETLSAPLRAPTDSKTSRWELPSLLDPRSREIEKNLGY